MQPQDYQRLSARTECDQLAARFRYMNGDPLILPIRLNHAVLGLMGEVGELAGAVERWLHYGKPLDRTNVVEEIGDSLWYLSLACTALGVDLGEVMESNIRKLRVRFPDKYTDQLAAEENRNRGEERKALVGDQ